MGVEAPSNFIPLSPPPRRILGSEWHGFHAIHWLMFVFILMLLLFACRFLLLLCSRSAPGDPLATTFLLPLLASLAGVAVLVAVLHYAYRRIRLTRWLCRAGIAVPGEVVAKRRGGPRRNIGIVRYRFLDPRTGKTVELEAEPPRRMWPALVPGHLINVLIGPLPSNAVVVYEFCRFTVVPMPASGIAGDTLAYDTPLPPYGPLIIKYALVTMLVATFLPIWTYWSISSRDAAGHLHIFWIAILAFPIRHPGLMQDVITQYLTAFSLAALLGAGIAALHVCLDRRLIRLRQSGEE